MEIYLSTCKHVLVVGVGVGNPRVHTAELLFGEFTYSGTYETLCFDISANIEC